MNNFDQFEITTEEMNNLEGGTWGCFSSYFYCAPKTTTTYCAPKTTSYCSYPTTNTCQPSIPTTSCTTTNTCQPKPSTCTTTPPVASLPSVPVTSTAS